MGTYVESGTELESEEENESRKPQNKKKTVAAKPSRKKINRSEEDVLIAAILKRFDVIENRATDKSLTPKNVEAGTAKAWSEIQAEYNSHESVTVSK